ncbi:hypothetical protein LFR94_004503 [Vibrio vulnificus]|uniref:hypothetical protein n=1 Tax=Vibrio vulnificus TaxID=672 RepID=UPI001A1E00F9|nr:hypothetical protein [Vibrio vulnificus]EGQ7958026.1 hypothetical protein [Vibrio vulnificus]EGQ7988575.1 hypothetical protein [Vibrio vulnificus]EGQ9240107.1 hypothetical protein [Vibrio vulnificus]EGR7964310.1 hypothetical protein [Vibrio vulnificus]EGR7987234.1 hypothetical protein [Vibrio vulnificus]
MSLNTEFSYYFEGVRYTNTELSFLVSLAANADDAKSVIDGILKSEERYNEEMAALASET